MANCKDNCDNNCAALDGLYEKAVNLIAYSDLINSWVNGPKNGTVNVAGTNVPTLLNLATTLKSKSDTLIANLQDRINNIPFSIIQSGGGLYVDSEGKLYIDFNQMPTDKFEAMLKSLRLPIWLTKNTSFYVNINHAAASDTLDDGRGLSAAKPFKTVQACVNYIANNYNVGAYNAYIEVAKGEYEGILVLPEFSRTTGKIVIRSADGNRSNAVIVGAVNASGGTWQLDKITIDARLNMSQIISASRYYYAIVQAYTGSSVSCTGCLFRFAPTGTSPAAGILVYCCYAYGGHFEFGLSDIANRIETAYDTSDSHIAVYGVCSGNNGSLTAAGTNDSTVPVVIEANAYFNVCANASGGTIDFSSPRVYKPYISNSVTYGTRYRAVGGGKISSGGQGANFFPGATAGTVEASTYSWYV